MLLSTDTDGALFQALRPRLLAISRRIVGSDAEAEDVVQECFLKWHGADRAALATPAAWLTTVVRHQSIDHLRKRAREAVAAGAASELAPETPVTTPEQGALLQSELGAALARMLACLSGAERAVLVLHEVMECGHADIAVLLATSAVNTRQHLARARKRLREFDNAARPEEKLCRELVRRFQAAINGMDAPAIATLLAQDQPVSVLRADVCANDGIYARALAA